LVTGNQLVNLDEIGISDNRVSPNLAFDHKICQHNCVFLVLQIVGQTQDLGTSTPVWDATKLKGGKQSMALHVGA
jgi:hypothetical protein